ncbi:uncharacterized protein TRAVEDRAFT_91307, partial [Trametes versicolor FP-101664 SS1]|uniref:uncharacterized protein n=1 Tax=Trametes versicolor (strain FP-101664) TaxID=717944 RepID=UPI0004623E38
MHSGETSQRLTKIPLVLGMPVILSQNYDVSGGIVNGSIGTLLSIRFEKDEASGRRYLISCTVKIDDVPAPAMTNMVEGQFPVMQDTV